MLKEKFENFLDIHPKLKTAQILVAVSGGVDSMVLCHLCKALRLKIALAHVNFHLRGDQSDQDQSFVEQFAKNNNLPIHVLHSDTERKAKKEKKSIQITARNIRYEWFDALMQEHNYDYLFTAHHLNDSVESFFINLYRGTGLKGLRGIKDRLTILRPLAKVTKEEIMQFAGKEEVDYRTDYSNFDNKYLRNWFRNELIPVWTQKQADFLQKMEENMVHLNEAYEIYESALREDLEQAGLKIKDKKHRIEFINQLKYPKASLAYLLNSYAYHESDINNILSSIKTKSTGNKFFSTNYEALLDREHLLIRKKHGQNSPEGIIYRYQDGIDSPVKLKMSVHDVNDLEFLNDKNAAYFDLNQLTFPITVRLWKEGDRIYPFGMKGSKKVSDVLVDQKLNRFEKEQAYVLENNQGILWLPGIKHTELAKVTKSTVQVLKMQKQDE